MGEIVNNIFENELSYDGCVILKYKIEYPTIKNSRNRYSARRFNEYNYNRALELKEYSENELFKEAKELYQYNSENGYPIMVYEVVLNYEITYRNNSVISLYTDEYMYLGGAHGNTKRESQNWNMQTGRFIKLAELNSKNPYYIVDIFKEINNQIAIQIESGEGQYFENYCNLVQENFKLENFYITENGIVIYFNQYEIAPYSSGIPEFLIKF